MSIGEFLGALPPAAKALLGLFAFLVFVSILTVLAGIAAVIEADQGREDE